MKRSDWPWALGVLGLMLLWASSAQETADAMKAQPPALGDGSGLKLWAIRADRAGSGVKWLVTAQVGPVNMPQSAATWMPFDFVELDPTEGNHVYGAAFAPVEGSVAALVTDESKMLSVVTRLFPKIQT